METTYFSSAIASISMLVCITTILISCASCKKIFKRKKKSFTINDEEKVVQNDEAKKENGISNPAYDEPTNKDTIESLDEAEDLTEKHAQENGNATADTPVPIVSSVQVENECATPKSMSNENPNEEEKQSEAECLEKTQEAENASAPSTDKVPPSTPGHQSLKFCESIHSDDIHDLSIALDGKARETIAEEEESAPPGSSTDGRREEWSKFDDVIIQGGWRREVKLTDLLQMGLIDTDAANEVMAALQGSNDEIVEESIPEKIRPFLFGDSPVAGILLSESGEKKSIYRSAKDGILRRGTAISLLEAQAATGNIIDPVTGRKMSVAEGFQLGLLDKVYETVVSRAERAVTGYRTRVTDETLSLGEAMERGLVIESHGIRLLEAQLATGGIIDHRANVKVPVDVAVARGLLDKSIAEKLAAACEDVPDADKSDDLKTFFDPNTEENVTYRELMRRSVVDDDTGMRLYPLEKIGRKRYSYASYSGRSSLASSRASSKESIPAAVAASPSSP